MVLQHFWFRHPTFGSTATSGAKPAYTLSYSGRHEYPDAFSYASML